MGFNSFRDLVIGEVDNGQNYISSFRKVPSQATSLGNWADLSMSPGNPAPNYYASSPLVAATLPGNEGIYTGAAVSPSTKHLKMIQMMSVTAAAVPSTYYLLDYLLYYPFVDMDSTDAQVLTNTVPLPRYEDGQGVEVMLVAQSSYTGGASYSITYTNQNGVSGRESQLCTSNSATTTSTLISTGTATARSFGPFIPLAQGDSGVRSVENITFTSGNGGIAALVLVKPLAEMSLREITAPHEKNFFVDTGCTAPRIYDNAYLNFIVLPNASLQAAPIMGLLECVWG